MKDGKTFGIYWNFPSLYHGVARFEFDASLSEIQRAILRVLYSLNGCNVKEQLSHQVLSDVDVIFEFGVADGLTFHYINEETLNILLETVDEKTLPIIDFFCVIRYYSMREGRRRALRFDYYFFRFIFGNSELEVQVFHERGLRRISVGDLIGFLAERINLELAGRGINPMELKHLRAL